MTRYTVIGLVDATTSEDVEADTPEAAAAAACLSASVCHQCSQELDVGDVYAVRVLDEDGEQVYSDDRIDKYDAAEPQLRALRMAFSQHGRKVPRGERIRLVDAVRDYLAALDGEVGR